MKKTQLTKVKTTYKGAPIANHAVVMYQSKKVSLVDVDFKSKWCKVTGLLSSDDLGNEVIFIEAQGRTPETSLNKKFNRTEPTGICLPEFKGWRVHMAVFQRYTLSIVFTKNL